MRAPVGGLFRHVMDLAQGQIARGHQVGLIADSRTGGTRAEEAFAALEPRLALGLSRVAMPRLVGFGDIAAARHVANRLHAAQADVVHGHGAKGGAYARLSAGDGAIRVYTPHGGSLHYDRNSLSGHAYLAAEKMLMPRGALYLFESAFSADTFRAKVGVPQGIMRVVHNGVGMEEFEPVPCAASASSVMFLGELRMLKGVDVLVEAIALARREGRALSATFIGEGPDSAALQALVANRGLKNNVNFMPPMPARQAMTFGRVMVIPSRAESLPYVVLEAAAAQKPLVATAVGGIPEIYGPQADELVPPGDAAALATAFLRKLDDPARAKTEAKSLSRRVAEGFSAEAMVERVLEGYRAALAVAKTAENPHR